MVMYVPWWQEEVVNEIFCYKHPGIAKYLIHHFLCHRAQMCIAITVWVPFRDFCWTVWSDCHY